MQKVSYSYYNLKLFDWLLHDKIEDMKKVIKILSVLLLITCMIAGFVFYGTFVSVKNVNIVNTTIIDKKIPDELSNFKIAFISDIHYGSFMDEERLSKMFAKINQAKPDVILFGGDLFDDPTNYPVTEKKREELIALLKTLEAPYGKFAVLGEEDHHPSLKDEILNIFYYGDFEMLVNQSVLLRKDSSYPINLVGIDSLVGGKADISGAMANIDPANFTIILTHAPDITSSLPKYGSDLILAGHSHGGQISLPIIGPIKKVEGAKTYTNGTYHLNQSTLIVSNGLGTTTIDMRLFSPPQCHMIRLSNKTTN